LTVPLNLAIGGSAKFLLFACINKALPVNPVSLPLGAVVLALDDDDLGNNRASLCQPGKQRGNLG